MAIYLGVDIGTRSVRAVRVRSAYRRLAIEAMVEAERSELSLVETVRATVAPLLVPGESVAVNFDGERTFVRRLEIPLAGQKQIAELVPFELEAELPFEIEGAVYDHIALRRTGDEAIPLLAAAARAIEVRERIDVIKEALGSEPERISPGALALAGLIAAFDELVDKEPILLLDIGEHCCEALIVDRGEPVFARTLSVGTLALPDAAPQLVRELRQTMGAFRVVGGGPIARIYLLGPGALVPNAEDFLRAELELDVSVMPAPNIPLAMEAPPGALLRCSKALGLALSLSGRGRSLNLRRGALVYEGGYGFLREKVPLLVGLALVIAASFAFSAVSEMWAAGRERATLEASLSALTNEVFGEATSDVQRANDLVEKSTLLADEDPLPKADAFDLMVQLAEAVPEGMAHDIEELDVQRGHATVHGIVPTIPDAQQLATQLKSHRCFQDVKIVRTNQLVGEDRQKYTLELEIKCPQEGKDKDKSASSPSGSASAAMQGAAKP